VRGRLHNGKLTTYRTKPARKGRTAFFWTFKTFGAAPILFSKDALAACQVPVQSLKIPSDRTPNSKKNSIDKWVKARERTCWFLEFGVWRLAF
jgi:hypothetical protein